MKFITQLALIVLSSAYLPASEIPEGSPENESPVKLTLEARVLSGKGKAMIGDRKITKGDFLDEQAWAGLVEHPSVDFLSAPTITVLPGKKAVLSIQEPLMYLELRDDGSLIPKTVSEEQFPGVQLETVLHPAEKQKVEVNYALRVNTLVSREPIPGVLIDGGLPNIAVSELKDSLPIPVETWVVAGYQKFRDATTDEVEYLMVLMRVSTT